MSVSMSMAKSENEIKAEKAKIKAEKAKIKAEKAAIAEKAKKVYYKQLALDMLKILAKKESTSKEKSIMFYRNECDSFQTKFEQAAETYTVQAQLNRTDAEITISLFQCLYDDCYNILSEWKSFAGSYSDGEDDEDDEEHVTPEKFLNLMRKHKIGAEIELCRSKEIWTIQKIIDTYSN
jgi:hypothetical protein